MFIELARNELEKMLNLATLIMEHGGWAYPLAPDSSNLLPGLQQLIINPTGTIGSEDKISHRQISCTYNICLRGEKIEYYPVYGTEYEPFMEVYNTWVEATKFYTLFEEAVVREDVDGVGSFVRYALFPNAKFRLDELITCNLIDQYRTLLKSEEPALLHRHDLLIRII